MQDILQQIIAHKREELAAIRAVCPLCGDRVAAPAPSSVPGGFPAGSPAAPKPSLRAALLASPTGIIAEFKRRSPSKGWINEAARPDVVPLAYQHSGAAALSILTDEHYFGGHDDFIRQARQSGVTLPILYKNFVIDEAQLYAAALCGASAVLLIAACLSKADCAALIRKAHALGLEVLLEMHSDPELEYAALGPDLCGINNRNLGSFVTDVENSFRLAEKLRAAVGVTDPTPAPPLEGRGLATALPAASGYTVEAPLGTIPDNDGAAAPLPSRGGVGGGVCNSPVLVSESGISDPATVRALRAAGFRGFLIGETFMKTPDPGAALRDFINELSK